MSFQTAYAETTSSINTLRKQMDSSCRNAVSVLATDLFAENPNVLSIYWTQTFDPAGKGFTLGTIYYEAVAAVDGRMVRQRGHLAQAGSAPVAQFARFLRSIAYHLFCAHGANVTVTVARAGTTVVAA